MNANVLNEQQIIPIPFVRIYKEIGKKRDFVLRFYSTTNFLANSARTFGGRISTAHTKAKGIIPIAAMKMINLKM